MAFNNSRILALLAVNEGYLLLERGFPANDEQKFDVLTACGKDGTVLTGNDDYGQRVSVPVDQAHLDDFLRAGLLRQDAIGSTEARVIYRLTTEGMERGLAVASTDGTK